jgi:hypothetical protein
MENLRPRAEWAQQMADTVQLKMLAKGQQGHQRDSLTQAQAEHLWITGMDRVVHTLTCLVQALQDTGYFPRLKLLAHARSPQGTTTYMRRGSLLSLKGLQEKTPTIEFEIDGASPFRADLLTPTVRVITISKSLHPTNGRKVHWCFGVSMQGAVIWQGLDPTVQIPAEGNVEEMLRSFLESQLLSE